MRFEREGRPLILEGLETKMKESACSKKVLSWEGGRGKSLSASLLLCYEKVWGYGGGLRRVTNQGVELSFIELFVVRGH